MSSLKNLTDWFDHVYLINCQHRPDRLARVLAHLENSGMATIADVKVVAGIIGDWTTHPTGWGGGRGAWGCLKSHIKVMESAMHLRDDRGQLNWNSILILEDDVFFVEDALSRLNSFMGSIPQDWGQLYLGGQHRRPVEVTTFPGVVTGRSVNRTHAYAVSVGHIQAIYRHVSYMPDYVGNNKHIDHQLELAHQRRDWPVYCPEQWVAGQDEGTSNVSGRINQKQLWL